MSFYSAKDDTSSYLFIFGEELAPDMSLSLQISSDNEHYSLEVDKNHNRVMALWHKFWSEGETQQLSTEQGEELHAKIMQFFGQQQGAES